MPAYEQGHTGFKWLGTINKPWSFIRRIIPRRHLEDALADASGDHYYSVKHQKDAISPDFPLQPLIHSASPHQFRRPPVFQPPTIEYCLLDIHLQRCAEQYATKEAADDAPGVPDL